MTNAAVGRFGHHIDPVCDFCTEVECIETEWQGMKSAIAEGAPVGDDFVSRVALAMDFSHGRDPLELDAKVTLREMEREILARALDYMRTERDMWKASAQAKRRRLATKPVTVWFGSMPESNGKSNWTALLLPKGSELWEGITLERSEYKDRVRYAADRVRYLLGEIPEEPDILAYDPDLIVSTSVSTQVDGEASVKVEPTRIGSLSDLHAAVGAENVVLIEYGDHRMATVSMNGRHVMTGNVWDFHPGCHGGWFYELAAKTRSFSRPGALAEVIAMEIRDHGAHIGGVTVDVREARLDDRER